MKKYFILCMLLCTLFLGACQAKNPVKDTRPKQSETIQLKKAKSIEVGVTYKIGKSQTDAFYIKFIDSQHYVYMIDESYYTEKEIEEKSGDGVQFYPHISFTEGTYSKQGEEYILNPDRTQRIEFKDPKHVKDKIIASKGLYEESDSSVIIIKEGGNYIEKTQNGSFILYEVNKNLSDSIDKFLAQYDYQPEELHW